MGRKKKSRAEDEIQMDDDSETSLYQVLGVETRATPQEIRKAYHKLALRLHPDKNQDDEEAKEKFQQLQKVISILGDEKKRAVYNQIGSVDDDDLSGDTFENLRDFFQTMYKKVTEADIKEFQANYRGSESEKRDLIELFNKFKGNMNWLFCSMLCSDPKLDSHRFKDILDEAIAAETSRNLSPLFLKQLLQYHTLPLMLPMNELLKKPQGTCLPTLLHHKSVEISTVDKESRTAEVNHVRISHPDMFLGDSLVIHGVLGPFSPLQPHRDHILQSSLCQSDTNQTSEDNIPVKIDWVRIIQLLSSNGYVPFAIVLHSVLNRMIVKDHHHKNLTGVTILATPNLISLSSASPLLYEVVRHQILVERLTNKDLASMPDKASVKTLDPFQDLIITRRNVNSSRGFMISGVEIVDPDMFSSTSFVIHGISHTLEIPLV